MNNYTRSNNIKVFPSSKRSSNYLNYAGFNTEQNITSLVNRFTKNKSYIIECKLNGNIISGKFNICGYYIEIKETDISNELQDNKYLYLKMNIANDVSNNISSLRLDGVDVAFDGVNSVYTGIEIIGKKNIINDTNYAKYLLIAQNGINGWEINQMIDSDLFAVDDGEMLQLALEIKLLNTPGNEINLGISSQNPFIVDWGDGIINNKKNHIYNNLNNSSLKIEVYSNYNIQLISSILGDLDNNREIKELLINKNVNRINKGVFKNCVYLSSITLPFVGGSASATIADETTLFGYIFGTESYGGIDPTKQYYGSGLYENYYIPYNLRQVIITGGEIFYGAFYNCKNIYVLNLLSENIKMIPKECLYNCFNLKNITLPNSVLSIETNAFWECKNLTSIKLPENLISIFDTAFFNCSSLTSVIFEGNSRLGGIGNSAFRGCSSLTEIVIPSSVTDIGASIFSGCSSLEKLTLPFVGGSASATIADETTLFGYIFGTHSYDGGIETEQTYESAEYATYYIPSSLKEVIITEKNVLYGAFSSCGNIEKITLSQNSTTIYPSTFFYCEHLEGITIPSNVTSIGYSAFDSCTYLTSINIPCSVTDIGEATFEYCSNLESVTFEENSQLTSISSSAFYNCSRLTSIVIPNTLESIGIGAFSECSSLGIIYYKGETISDWETITIAANNNPLLNASIYYYSETEPQQTGQYWHYVNGQPQIWN